MPRFFLSLILLFSFSLLSAQEGEGSGVSDTIVYIQDSDTIREIVIEEVSISDDSKSKLTKEEREQIKLLERRVRVVYPYAKLTAEKLTQINTTMAKLKTQKEKKKYFKLVEKYLNDEFEPKLKKLSRKQGQILIKLINRQTGQTTFDLIKDYKSGWKAFWSNNTAKLFNIDLKRTYNPMEVPEDFYIETYLQRCFDEGKLVKQEAKKPISEIELNLNWSIKNKEKQKVGN
jgi:inorganic triphosphatase YgiF